MNFDFGKVPTNILEKTIFRNLGKKRTDVILSSAIGEDAAIVKVGNEVLAIATDPVTGAEEQIGWLSVNVSANDVATCGVQPCWFISCILLPKGSKSELINRISKQIHKATRLLDMAVITGHCEITPNIDRPIVVGCSIGIAKNGKYVTSSGAKPGNHLILTKGVGIEGTAILASDRREDLLKIFNKNYIKKAEKFFEKISVVKDALIAFKTGGVNAMHDPTEGGILGGLHELADAANVGLKVYEKQIHINNLTKKICSHFKIDPLQLISSGSLLIVAQKKKSKDILNNLSQNGIDASIIGEVKKHTFGRKLISKNDEKIELIRPVSDHLWEALID